MVGEPDQYSASVKTSNKVVSEVGRIILDIEEQGHISLATFRKIEGLIETGPGFTEKNAQWLLKNHQKLILILNHSQGKIVLQHAFKPQSHISKIIRDTRITRPTFYKVLNLLKELDLVIDEEHIKGTAKYLNFNFAEHKTILQAVLTIIGQK